MPNNFPDSYEKRSESIVNKEYINTADHIDTVYQTPIDGPSISNTNVWICQFDFSGINSIHDELHEIINDRNFEVSEQTGGLLLEMWSENGSEPTRFYRLIPVEHINTLLSMKFRPDEQSAKNQYYISSGNFCDLCGTHRKYGCVSYDGIRENYHIDCFRAYKQFIHTVIQNHKSYISSLFL